MQENQTNQKLGRRLVMADGTRIEDGEAGFSDGFLWLWFDGYTIQQAAAISFDQEKTKHIVFEYGENQDEYNGYINCRTLSIDAGGKLSVCMTKGE